MDNKEKRIEEILKALPQGSGFNSNWGYKEYKNGNVDFQTLYHNMNDNGMYDGFTSVRIKIEKSDLFDQNPDFSMYLSGKRKYTEINRDYYSDTIFYALDALKGK